jgi:hypothetical protein
MDVWRGVLYAVAVFLLVLGGFMLLAGTVTKRPVVSALAYFAAACALLAFSLPTIAAT